MSLEDDLNQPLEKAIGAAMADSRMGLLLTGRMSHAELHAFFRRLIVAHLNSGHLAGFLYSLAPPGADDLLRQKMEKELGAEGDPARSDLLLDLAKGLGFTDREQERLIAEANEARRKFATEAALYPTLRLAGLSILIETLAFETFLTRLSGPVAEALTSQYDVPSEAVQWFTLYGGAEAGQAEEERRVVEQYISFYRLSASDVQGIVRRAFTRNPILERYFPPAAPGTGTSARGRLVSIDIIPLQMPFTRSMAQATPNRTFSEPIVVRVRDAEGVTGYGEALPRPHVSGEDVQSTIERLRYVLAPQVLASDFASGGAVGEEIRSAEAKWSRSRRPEDTAVAWNTAQCAMELAIFDWAFKRFGASISELLIPARRDVVYTGVANAEAPEAAAALCKRYMDSGLARVKIKVGIGDDVARLDAVRGVVGPDVAIRIDANGAWTAEEAIMALTELQPFDIEAVEQPVAASDIEGMLRVREETGMRIVADESLVRVKDAQALIKAKACDVFNIQVSKCGGLISSRRLALAAREAGLGVQIGAHIGETSILSAAGRHLAAHLPEVDSLEGSMGTHLFTEDVAREPVMFGYGGQTDLLIGDGLGVEIDEAALERLALEIITVTA
ncbi:MAG: L-alanine-DL-glutamate epimerase [Chloroflexi bacterium]|jgi:muconate cycloisomerase|nr:MAG: L-alanine-DL-glutamate epimerase [Chloroflexota bacterium]